MKKPVEVPPVTREAFDAMTIEQQRVAVALDAAAQAKAERFVPMSGTWLQVGADGESLPAAVTQDTLTAATRPTCYGCGLGGALYSLVRLGNRYDHPATPDGLDLMDFRDRLEEVFEPRQVALIEIAFECGYGFYDPDDVGSDAYHTASTFGEQFGLDKARFIAIMENIAAHNGEFVP